MSTDESGIGPSSSGRTTIKLSTMITTLPLLKRTIILYDLHTSMEMLLCFHGGRARRNGSR